MSEALVLRPTLAASQLLQRALAWWIAELADMAPRALVGSLRQRLGRETTDAAVLDLSGSQPVLQFREPGRRAPFSVVLADAPADRHERVNALLRRHPSRKAVTVRLNPGQLFVTTIDLPSAAARSLDAVIRHQIALLMPVPPEQIHYAYRELRRSAGAPRLLVAVAVAKRATVDQALAVTRGVGLIPRRIAANVPEAGPAPLVLWQADRAQPANTPKRRRLLRTLEAAAVAFAVAAYGLHVYRLDQIRDGLQDAVAQARQTAAATRALGQRAALSTEALSFLRERRQEPQPLQVLDSLTRLLPLDTWVSDLTLRGRAVEIIGSTAHAANLIPLIEGSAAFGHPQFRSPITLLPDGSTERFDLTLDVKTGAVKAGAVKADAAR